MSIGTFMSTLDFLSACAQILGHSARRGSKHTPVPSSAKFGSDHFESLAHVDPAALVTGSDSDSVSQQSICGQIVFGSPLSSAVVPDFGSFRAPTATKIFPLYYIRYLGFTFTRTGNFFL